MRSMWKGSISFGLVNVPIQLYKATESHDIRFHQVHKKDGGRIRYRRTCDTCDEEVPREDIVKGYETSSGELVMITDEDLEKLPHASGHEIDVVQFVDSVDVDPLLFDKSYYLEPSQTGAKPYALLRQVLETTDKMAIVTITLRQRESLAALRVRDKIIVLQTLLWPDEIRQPDFKILDEDVNVRDKEVQMAKSLVENLTEEFEPEKFDDEYMIAMQKLIDEKVESGEVHEPTQQEKKKESSGDGEVVDLMSALQASVDRAKQKGGSKTPQKKSKSSRKTTKQATGKKTSTKSSPKKTA